MIVVVIILVCILIYMQSLNNKNKKELNKLQGIVKKIGDINAYAKDQKSCGDAYMEECQTEGDAIKRAAEEEAVAMVVSARKDVERILSVLKDEHLQKLEAKIESAEKQHTTVLKKIETAKNKLQKQTYLLEVVNGYFERFSLSDPDEATAKKIVSYIEELECSDLLNPTTELKLHNTDVKDLRKQYKEIDMNIEATLEAYEKRYTTKSNLAIYRLMVIALRAELQNVLYALRFQKLDESEDKVHQIADKYLKITGEVNQQIAPTIAKFISEIEELFLEAVRVEYEYYVRKERAKEEQKALREQMKQEAEERKALETQKKQIEKEESKYLAEIEKLKEQLLAEQQKGNGSEKALQVDHRIEELEALLASVDEKKEEIVKLQNGKAGYVYIISNLGSFGDSVFKIGMTRRLEPQERVDELGSASVPFQFDVHSFIFSEDAPSLENKLHNILNDKRTNKVNLRKEFFTVSLDELEALVTEIEPTAEFNRTMLAEEYKQSLSFASVLIPDDDMEPEDAEDTILDDAI